MIQPIWKEKWVVLDEFHTSAEFYVMKGGTEIYRGVAVRRPGDADIRIRINDICADYLTNETEILLDTDSLDARDSYIVATFTTYLANGTLKDTTEFCLDYSYEPMPTSMHDSIDGRYLATLPTIYSVREATIVDDGEDQQDCDTSANFFIPAGTDTFTANDVEIHRNLVNVCDAFVLFYVNEFGGWDELICEGRHLHGRDISRSIIGRDYEEGFTIDPSHRGKREYQSTITERWQLTTPVLTDYQASKMHHLLTSNNVWLVTSEDIANGDARPVILTDTVCDDKTYDNQGNQLFFYTINCELAQTRKRK